MCSWSRWSRGNRTGRWSARSKSRGAARRRAPNGGGGATRWATGPTRGRGVEAWGCVGGAGEVEQLRRLPVSQREAGWNDFWKRRDPTPETPKNEALIEFVRRVRYAEDHFQGFGPGWRSDMGRVYIRYG